MKDFYRENHEKYFERTFNIDPSSFLSPLAAELQPGAFILDVGCGSGRDLLWLKNRGFRVMGFERSPELAELARKSARCDVLEGDFTSYDFSSIRVDAVILIGALVHIPHEKMAYILAAIIKSLNVGGYLLITLKEGKGNKASPDGRVFYLWEHTVLLDIFAGLGLIPVDFSRQFSKIHQDDVWLGYLLQKTL